jgi:alcohol dehydrogenase
MRALVLDESLKVLADYPEPEPGVGEALVRVHLAGICNTDLELLRGYMAFQGIPGHEFVGTVERAPGAQEWVGRRVVGDINLACGECPTCRAGRPTHCPNRSTLGIGGHAGAFADYLVLPTCNLHTVPESVPDEAAVFTEPLAAACEILEQVHVRPSNSVVVLGDGKLGLLCAQVLALCGCQLTLVGHHTENLALIDRPGLVTTTRLPDAVEADLVVEATGSPGGYAVARRLVRPRGTIVLKSTIRGQIDADLTSVVVDEVVLLGSRCGPFGPALRLLAQDLVRVVPMISNRYPLAEALEAFEDAARPGTLKVLLDAS